MDNNEGQARTVFSKKQWNLVQPWISFLVRVSMAVIMFAAAIPKFADLDQSVRAVRAYELLPEVFVPAFGTLLPFAEAALGLVLLVGAFTRLAAYAWILLMVVFIFGTFWAWANGLNIDCGCFGGGGAVDYEVNYLPSFFERFGFLALGVFLAIWPRSALSVDAWMAPDEPKESAA